MAAGDVNGDGTADIITGAGGGAGAAPHVKVFDGRTSGELSSFLAYGAGFTGGVYVAAGDVDGDTVYDIVTGAGNGGNGHVKVFDGATGSEMKSFFAFGGGTAAEVRVAAGDVNGDGHADIITGRSDLSQVRVFDGDSDMNSELMSFNAYPGLSGGGHVASGDIDGDGLSDIITGAGDGAGGMPHVKVFSGATGNEIRSFFAYPSALSELRVAAGDVDGDGRDDIITAPGPGAAPHVKAFSGRDNSPLASFFAYNFEFTGGVYVAGITVPEPASVVLLSFAVAVVPCRRRRAPVCT